MIVIHSIFGRKFCVLSLVALIPPILNMKELWDNNYLLCEDEYDLYKEWTQVKEARPRYINIRVDCQITHPHHLCIFISHYQKFYYYCTLTSALTLIFLMIWPPICLFFIKTRIWWYVTAYLHALIQKIYSFTSSCSVLHWYNTGPLCKFRIFLHLLFSCKVFVFLAVFFDLLIF